MKSRNAYYHSGEKIISSLLPKNINISIHRTTTLPVVLHRCETLSLPLRVERTLRLFENRMLRIMGPKNYEVTEQLRKLHNEELKDLYSSPNIIPVIKSRRMRWKGHIVCMGDRRGVYRILVGNVEGRETEPCVNGRIILK
jgi:hypothetical protein